MSDLIVHGKDYKCVHVFMYNKDENIPAVQCNLQ